MDPSYESSDDEASAMAAAMGFSTFGTQGPPKKRRFNPSTDAVVEGQALVALDKGGKKGQGSGGNTIPLGKPRVFGVAKATPASNDDEIDLDGDDDDEETGPNYVDTSLPPPLLAGGSGEEGPNYVDTSLPPPDEEARTAQERIDAILAGAGGGEAIVPSRAAKNKDKGKEAGRGIGQFMAALQQPQTLPQPPVHNAGAPEPVTNQQPVRGQRGQRNELWYLGYYDPSFNENPWAAIEKKNGLQPRGTWVERQGARVV